MSSSAVETSNSTSAVTKPKSKSNCNMENVEKFIMSILDHSGVKGNSELENFIKTTCQSVLISSYRGPLYIKEHLPNLDIEGFPNKNAFYNKTTNGLKNAEGKSLSAADKKVWYENWSKVPENAAAIHEADELYKQKFAEYVIKNKAESPARFDPRYEFNEKSGKWNKSKKRVPKTSAATSAATSTTEEIVKDEEISEQEEEVVLPKKEKKQKKKPAAKEETIEEIVEEIAEEPSKTVVEIENIEIIQKKPKKTKAAKN